MNRGAFTFRIEIFLSVIPSTIAPSTLSMEIPVILVSYTSIFSSKILIFARVYYKIIIEI